MIRYRPARNTMSFSMKDERFFSSRDEMILTLFSDINKVLAFIGSKPILPSDLVIDPEGFQNPQCGYADEHKVFVRNKCIGFCDI